MEPGSSEPGGLEIWNEITKRNPILQWSQVLANPEAFYRYRGLRFRGDDFNGARF